MAGYDGGPIIPPPSMKTIYLVANGDLRLSANQKCQEAQAAMEAQVVAAVEREGFTVQRAHPFDPEKGHGFIDSQKHGMEVFRHLPKDAPPVVAGAVWQYSHHILHGLLTHHGPILTVANWSGTWPGLVGMLNLNGSMTRAGARSSTLWSDTFDDKKYARRVAGHQPRPDDGAPSVQPHPGRLRADEGRGARQGLFAKAAAMRELGLEVSLCGDV